MAIPETRARSIRSYPEGKRSVSRVERNSMVQKLVVLDTMIRNNQDPNIDFAMSDIFYEQCLVKRESLFRELSLPDGQEKREKIITSYRNRFNRQRKNQ